MGLFSKLKHIDGAQKLVKFKQGALLASLRDAGSIPEALFTTAKDGACAAYTAAWLDEKYDPTKYLAQSQFERVRTDLSLKTATDHAYNQNNYARTKQHWTLLNNYTLRSVQEVRFDNFVTMAQHANDALKPGTGMYVSYRCNKLAEGRHAVGFFREAAGSLHFFDSNMGEYKVTSPRIVDPFTYQYMALILANFQYEPNEIIGYHLERGHYTQPGADF